MHRFSVIMGGLLSAFSVSSVFAASVSGQIEADSRIKKLIVYLSQEEGVPLSLPAKVYSISQKNTKFQTPLSIISAGDSLQWVNNEAKEIDHNIFSLSDLNRFDLGLGAKGSVLTHTFHNVGIQNYYCSVHKTMEGKVVILPNTLFQFLPKPAVFTIENVPEGRWTLNAIVFHRRYKAVPITFNLTNEAVTQLNLKIIKR